MRYSKQRHWRLLSTSTSSDKITVTTIARICLARMEGEKKKQESLGIGTFQHGDGVLEKLRICVG